MGSLKAFVDTYLKNKKVEDYEGWVAANGKDATAAYNEALATAESDYARSLATHGSRADRLMQRGLTGSGYSDYLSGKATEAYTTAKQAALTRRQRAEAESREGYARYLTDTADAAEKEARSVYKNAVTALYASDITDEDTAVTLLKAYGLDEPTAKAVAATHHPSPKDEGQAAILRYCIENYLSPSAALAYAKGSGLSEEGAAAVAEAVRAIYQSYYD